MWLKEDTYKLGSTLPYVSPATVSAAKVEGHIVLPFSITGFEAHGDAIKL